jgi:hypothetical protein
MEHHSELLNLIAKKIKARHYLEIGVFNPDHNFNKIDVLMKVGVDPDPNAKATICATSDDFFETAKEFGDKFELIWLDGLHEAEQIKKDIINAWQCLRPGGVIAIHDSNPHKESITHFPRDSREWTGNVYKTISNIKTPKFTVDFDYGCCILRKPKTFEAQEPCLFISDNEITWEHFDANRKNLLNLVGVDEAIKIIDAWI